MTYRLDTAAWCALLNIADLARASIPSLIMMLLAGGLFAGDLSLSGNASAPFGEWLQATIELRLASWRGPGMLLSNSMIIDAEIIAFVWFDIARLLKKLGNSEVRSKQSAAARRLETTAKGVSAPVDEAADKPHHLNLFWQAMPARLTRRMPTETSKAIADVCPAY